MKNELRLLRLLDLCTSVASSLRCKDALGVHCLLLRNNSIALEERKITDNKAIVSVDQDEICMGLIFGFDPPPAKVTAVTHRSKFYQSDVVVFCT